MVISLFLNLYFECDYVVKHFHTFLLTRVIKCSIINKERDEVMSDLLILIVGTVMMILIYALGINKGYNMRIEEENDEKEQG